MCDLRNHFPCLSGCPNAEEEQPVCTCHKCKEPIFEGDRIAEIDGHILCESCVEGIKASDWLKMIGSEWQEAS